MTGLIIGIIVGVLAVIIIAYVITTYNTFVKLTNLADEGFSTMDVHLKKRWDLVPNLVATVKGYAKHEKETFEKVVALRNGAYDNMSPEAKMDVNNQLTAGITKLLALAEAYPELKANENFRDLSKQLTDVEGEIASSRKYYNGTVRKLNDKVRMFPSNIVANIFKFKTRKMFEIDAIERQNVKVEF